MLNKTRVSAVSYLNTAPLVYGLMHTPIKDTIDLILDYPAECARKVLAGESKLGLVPLGSIVNKPNFHILTNYCIGANNRVRTVSLLSHSPIDEIDTIFLDYQSLTSVTLIKILAKHLWKKNFVWKPFGPHDNFNSILPKQGVVAIGDKVFGLDTLFKMNYDLAHQWHILTGLPMVFAVWTSSERHSDTFINSFNKAFSYGLSKISDAVTYHGHNIISNEEATSYLTQNISFDLDKKKMESIKLFKHLSKEFLG